MCIGCVIAHSCDARDVGVFWTLTATLKIIVTSVLQARPVSSSLTVYQEVLRQDVCTLQSRDPNTTPSISISNEFVAGLWRM